jgi:IMP dehydrogenase
MFDHRIEKLPLIDEDRHIRGLITKKDIILSRQRPYSSRDEKGRLLVGAAIGARGDFLERAAELIRAEVDVVLIDIAHGHTEIMRQAVESFRQQFGAVELICGNVGTTEGARFLRDLGADAIKVGIGPGRGCRTRLETAAGVPQVQALREAWCAVEESVPIIADGGVRNDKDIFLALVCGASSVMLGSALSGTDEAPGHVIENPATRQKSKIYRGMTSPQAVFETLYDTDDSEAVEAALDVPAEGQEVQIPYQGSVVDILQRVRGHLRSAVSYGGGNTLAEVRAQVVSDPLRFLISLSPAARRESYER